MKLRDPVQIVVNKKGSDVHFVAADATVYEALVMMANKRIGAVPVMDGKKLVGMFSERDYARKEILVGRSSREMQVSEIMSSPVVTVEPHSTIDECMQLMTARRCRHLPVMEGDRVRGIISIRDFVAAEMQQVKQKRD